MGVINQLRNLLVALEIVLTLAMEWTFVPAFPCDTHSCQSGPHFVALRGLKTKTKKQTKALCGLRNKRTIFGQNNLDSTDLCCTLRPLVPLV